MSDYNVIYLDDDGRNAPPVVRPAVVDNRPRWAGGFTRPGIMVPASTRPTMIQTGARPMYGAPAYAPAPTVYYHPPAQPAQASVFGNVTVAELLDLGSQVVAALRPLPTAPAAQGDVETDVANLVIYQAALAAHAQWDERLRTLGTVGARLVRR